MPTICGPSISISAFVRCPTCVYLSWFFSFFSKVNQTQRQTRWLSIFREVASFPAIECRTIFEFGKKFCYSNCNYSLIQIIVRLPQRWYSSRRDYSGNADAIRFYNWHLKWNSSNLCRTTTQTDEIWDTFCGIMLMIEREHIL